VTDLHIGLNLKNRMEQHQGSNVRLKQRGHAAVDS